jgi:hypothetical protein
MPRITTTEAAELLGTTQQNVKKWCQRHGVEKLGRIYSIDETTLARIAARLGKPGREKKEENHVP